MIIWLSTFTCAFRTSQYAHLWLIVINLTFSVKCFNHNMDENNRKVLAFSLTWTTFNPQMSCSNSGKWPLLYYSPCLCVLHFNVVFLLYRTSPLIFDAFPSVLVCNPNLFFFVINRLMNFEQRYTTIAFMDKGLKFTIIEY